MNVNTNTERVLFGLKMKRLRQEQGLSFKELAAKVKISISYLNEIEKGKKFPKEEKVALLAAALGVEVDDLVNNAADSELIPVISLLNSNFLSELPLDIFGIDLSKVVEIIANAPAQVGAFISALLEISRNYALKEEHFFFAALRSYLQLHNNYFQEIEDAVSAFKNELSLANNTAQSSEVLKLLLIKKYGYTIETGLEEIEELQSLRSVFFPKNKRLLLNANLNERQLAFQYGKELGFQYLGLKARAKTSSLLKPTSFEEVLNHSRAIYFSVALRLPLETFIENVKTFFNRKEWSAAALEAKMEAQNVSPEMFFQRLTNVMPKFFGMNQLFFLRIKHNTRTGHYEIDKEMQLNRRHPPHSNGLSEHYCRRWVALSIIDKLDKTNKDVISNAQVSQFVPKGETYLSVSCAHTSTSNAHIQYSLTIGVLLNDVAKDKIAFWNDPAIAHQEVGTTCERCSIQNCTDRKVPSEILDRKLKLKRIQSKLEEMSKARLPE